MTAEEASHFPIATDTEIENRINSLIGRARKRQLWLLFLDTNNCQLPLVIPVGDYPTTPTTENTTLFAARIKEAMVASGAVKMILVWERHASERITAADAAWATQLAEACSGEEIEIRAQFISHRLGVRRIQSEAGS